MSEYTLFSDDIQLKFDSSIFCCLSITINYVGYQNVIKFYLFLECRFAARNAGPIRTSLVSPEILRERRVNCEILNSLIGSHL